MKTKKNEKELGYGKPPEHSRFKPGQSGNTLGRPKKNKSTKDLIEEALKTQVMVNGKPMTKKELIIHSLVNDAIKGKTEARKLVLSQMADDEDLEEFDPSMDDKIEWMKTVRRFENQEKQARKEDAS